MLKVRILRSGSSSNFRKAFQIWNNGQTGKCYSNKLSKNTCFFRIAKRALPSSIGSYFKDGLVFSNISRLHAQASIGSKTSRDFTAETNIHEKLNFFTILYFCTRNLTFFISASKILNQAFLSHSLKFHRAVE